MAAWPSGLGRGLQSPVRRFDSARRLQGPAYPGDRPRVVSETRWTHRMSQPAMNPPPALHLHRWSDPVVVGVALCAMASGFGQFGVVAALGDVARTFGQVHHGASLTDQAGLSGTQLGIGLAVIRLASIGALPLTGLADRFGRRRMLLTTVAVGLAVTSATTALKSPTHHQLEVSVLKY